MNTITYKLTTRDSKIKTKPHAQDSIPSFIRKTYDILEERKFPDIIDWNPEGTALVIKKPTEFCQKVLPAYFKHNNLTSFVRQLNMYNFHKRRTQSLDHIYYHELFQKGKKYLLKEIKRKTSENALEKAQKATVASETSETSQSGQDASSLAYENQFLKRLYNDAMAKLAMLENQVKNVKAQNQSLWSQLYQQSDYSGAEEKQSELTQEQLPLTLGEFTIPPLRKQQVDTCVLPVQEVPSLAKAPSINCFLNFGEEITESTATEISQSSTPQYVLESEKCFDLGETFQLPALSLTPQVSQLHGDLQISRQELSMGQIFEAWNFDHINSEAPIFSENKTEKDTTTVLGKRQFEDDEKFNIPEPQLKRNELSIFSQKGIISTGTEDLFKMMLCRENSTTEEYGTMGLDLVDFNQSFCGWTKTA